jgi:hypothetical protein
MEAEVLLAAGRAEEAASVLLEVPAGTSAPWLHRARLAVATQLVDDTPDVARRLLAPLLQTGVPEDVAAEARRLDARAAERP